MATTNYASTMRAAREQGNRRGIASEISSLIRQIDLLERRDRVTKDYAPRLARLILDHAAIGKSLRTATVQRDSRFAFWQGEEKALGEEIDKKLRYYLTETGDPDVARLGLTAWARKVLKAAAAPKRAARPGDRPGKATTGTCKKCGKRGRLNHQGQCDYCAAVANTGNTRPPKATRPTARVKRARVDPVERYDQQVALARKMGLTARHR